MRPGGPGGQTVLLRVWGARSLAAECLPGGAVHFPVTVPWGCKSTGRLAFGHPGASCGFILSHVVIHFLSQNVSFSNKKRNLVLDKQTSCGIMIVDMGCLLLEAVGWQAADTLRLIRYSLNCMML